MVARVIADFETILVELRNLLPCHVILFVFFKLETFGNEKRSPKLVLF